MRHLVGSKRISSSLTPACEVLVMHHDLASILDSAVGIRDDNRTKLWMFGFGFGLDSVRLGLHSHKCQKNKNNEKQNLAPQRTMRVDVIIASVVGS